MSTLEGYAISPQQKRFWKFQKDHAIPRVMAILALKGALSKELLKESISQLIARHDILRSRFVLPEFAKYPLQVISEETQFFWCERTLDPNLKVIPQDWFDKELAIPVETDCDSVLRATLVTAGKADAYLILNLPALHADSDSFDLLTRDLCEIYDALEQSKPVDVDPVQYALFTQWLQDETEGGQEVKAFWVDRQQEYSNEEIIERSSKETRAAYVQLEPTRLNESAILTQLDARVEPGQLFLACWQIALARRAGTPRISLAIAFNGRTIEDLDTCCGPFTSSLPLTVAIHDNQSIAHVLEQVQTRQEQYEERAHFYGLEHDQQETAYAYQWFPQSELKQLAGLSVSIVGRRHTVATAGLKCTVIRQEKGYQFHFNYNATLYTADFVANMAELLERLVLGAVLKPDRLLGSIDILTESERHRIQTSFNEHEPVTASTEPVYQHFEKWASNRPQRIALAYEEQELSYAELNGKANQLARYLRARGVGPQVAVAVSIDRSLEMVVALLAVMKTGGIYVPVDATLPPKRIASLIVECHAQQVLVQTQNPEMKVDVPMLALDQAARQIAIQTDANPSYPVATTFTAYAIFTSGSTGRPKAVLVSHANLQGYVAGVIGRMDADEGTYAVVSTPAADLGNTMIYPSLSVGGTLHVISQQRIVDGNAFGDYLEKHRIDYLKITPAHLKALMSQQQPARVLPEKCLVLGGEASTWELVESIQALAPNLRILNHYGPTETTVGVSTYAYTGTRISENYPLGKPMAGVQHYVLNAQMQLMPVELTGELCIGGNHVTRGYLDQPAQTAARFVPDPFSGATGGRLYRSGDRARFTDLGNLEFAGRIDHQLKIRGYRVEPAEVATLLVTHGDADEAVVVPFQEADGSLSLAAYVVATGQGDEALRDRLYSYINQRLPAYMTPAHWIFLAQLPLTANGKIDRKALPKPDLADIDHEHAYQAPRNRTEEKLAEIWTEILALERIGVYDSFFSQGGQSLNGTIIMARVNQEFGTNLYLLTLFEKPTIEHLAQTIHMEKLKTYSAQELTQLSGLTSPPQHLEELTEEWDTFLATQIAAEQVSKETIPALPRAEDEQSFPLSFAQQRLWFLYQLEGASANYNIPTALRLEGQLHIKALEKALATIMERHEVLRTSFEEKEGEAIQIIHLAQQTKMPLVDLSGLALEVAQAKARELAARSAGNCFDLGKAPLMTTQILMLAQQNYVFLANMHHIVSDGWSNGVLIRELKLLYSAEVSNREAQLPELTIQYADFASWQRATYTEPKMAKQLQFWEEQLRGAPDHHSLATDYARPADISYRGELIFFQVAAAETAALKALAEQQSSSLFMVLHAVLISLIARYSHERDIVLGTVVANRNQQEIESLIGFFVNTLALRTRIPENPTYLEILAQVRQEDLAVIQNQEVPFERIVEALKPARHFGYTPLFQIMLVLQNASHEELQLAGVETGQLQTGRVNAKFDLTWNLEETRTELRGYVEYSTELFAAASIKRMIGHYQNLLAAVSQNPTQRLNDLPLQSSAERARVLALFSKTETDYPRDQNIQDVFAQRVARQSEAIAIEHDSARHTYQAIEWQATHQAKALLAKGVRQGDTVGVCLERTPELLISLIAILKVGGIYVPMDLRWPEDRLAVIATDAGFQVLITTEAETLSSLELTRLQPSAWNPSQPESLPKIVNHRLLGAYLNYTSGSTGTPKGVLTPHQAVLRLVLNTNYVKFDEGSIGLNISNISFDGATFEIWGPLLSGGRCVLYPKRIPEPKMIGALIKDHGVNTMFMTPSLFHQVIDEEPQYLKGLKQMYIGGEAMQAKYMARAMSALPDIKFVNSYGPTENTTFSVCHVLKTKPQQGMSVPIGTAISNTRAYVLSPSGTLLPIGVVGELNLAGDGLSSGYYKRPAQTAAVFVPDPYCKQPGGRLYRTGDLVRINQESLIDFQGRYDQQIKLRGFRIELGEINAALTKHPAVSDAHVIYRKDTYGLQLVGYVQVQGEEPANLIQSMRDHLTESLPEYMVPAAWVILDAFPLTPNGKMDHKALPAPNRSGSEQDYEAPRNADEEKIAELFCNLLGLERIGIHQNFFDSGGHSLLATRVLSQVRSAYQREIPLRDFFNDPTVAALAKRVQQSEETTLPAIEPVAREAGDSSGLPLSYAQQRLWFLNQLEGPSPTYNVPLTLRLKGKLSQKVLKQTMKELVRRHEVLRTSFPNRDGKAEQKIQIKPKVIIPVLNLQYLGEAALEEANQRLTEDSATSFQLETGPLYRIRLIRLAAEDHILRITLHHIISDGWSMGILVQELATLYRAYHAGAPSPLPELALQYADFAAWQQKWLQGEVLERQIQYWQQNLTGGPSLLTLPTDRPRPETQSYRGSVKHFAVNAETTAGMNRYSQETGATLFMLLLANFKLLLSSYSTQKDIQVGTPIANRNRKEIEPLIGFFVNTLVLRSKLWDNPSFRNYLETVKETALGAYANQDVPFERIVEKIQPERSLSYSPLFQVIFTLQNNLIEDVTLPGLSLEPMKSDGEAAKFDMNVQLMEVDDHMRGAVEYNTDLFDAKTIQRFIAHFKILMQATLANPDLCISDYTMLGEEEKQQLLVEWNDTKTEFPLHKCVHQLFEEQVERTPGAVALLDHEGEISYRELNAKANRIAHVLVEQGMGPETLIALLHDRNIAFGAMILGVFKAGAAYLPLDPYQPLDRRIGILERSAANMLLATRTLADQLAELVEATAYSQRTGIVEDLPLAKAAEQNLTNRCRPENLAYVIYTSGSTGLPKGAMLVHRGMTNHLYAKIKQLGLSEADTVSQDAATTFDISVWQYLGALLVGGRARVVTDEVAHDPHLLLQEMVKVTIFEVVPSVLAVMMEEVHRRREAAPELPQLRWLMSSGEALPPKTCRHWFEAYAHVPILNMWGATEASDDVTHKSITEPPSTETVNMPLGHPIGNIQVYLVDSRLSLLPIGMAGELLIGGAGVGRGYLRDPQRTAKVFVPNPFAREPGTRVYRSGDLARFMPDGNPEFLGRIDFQVKIRGFRIELGEIEVVLGHHPRVGETVVVAWGEESRDKRLVAYVTRTESEDEQDDAALERELHTFITDKLPDYMRPSIIQILQAMPLNPNGKIDRRALPDPEGVGEATDEYAAPRNDTEQKIAASWGELLHQERVGIHANFFELGGHSLLATQVVARVREIFAVDLPLRMLFEAPTVAQLAQRVESLRVKRMPQQRPAIKAVSRDKTLPLSYAQQRLWFLAELDKTSDAYNIPSGLILKGQLSITLLERSLNEISKRHEVLRSYFPLDAKGSPVQHFHAPESQSLPVVDLMALPEEERREAVKQISIAEFKRPFQMDTGPLARHQLIRMKSDEFAQISTIHHINFDGWSGGILVNELTQLYTALLSGKPSPLAELEIQYADYAHWQRSQEMEEEHLNYWKEQLDGAPDLLELPLDWPRPPIQQFKGNTIHLPLEVADLKTQVTQMSQRSEATLFMIFKAAFAALLYRYSHQEDVIIGSPYANREDKLLENLIGFFVNTLVFRSDLKGDPTFMEFLARERRTSLEAYIHQETPFEQIVEAIKPTRNLGYNALIQAMFLLLNMPEETLELPGVSLAPLPLERDVSPFDITMSVLEKNGNYSISLQYNTALLSAETATTMMRHYQNLLRALFADPQQKLSRIPLLDETERNQVLSEWNQTEWEFDEQQCIHHHFEQQVRQAPDQIALEYRGRKMSYRQLNARANQIAGQLRQLGVGLERTVGLCLERNLELVVGLLGILKAGGVYVPMDSQYPEMRLNYIIENAGMTLILTEPEQAKRLAATGHQPIFLDQRGWRYAEQAQEWVTESELDGSHPAEENHDSGVSPHNGAYIIYTSGSTGKPKGVMAAHHGFISLTQNSIETYGSRPGKRHLQLMSFNFDGASFLLFIALCSGATMVLLTAESHALGAAVSTELRNGITHVIISPALLTVIPVEPLPHLEMILVGGETCPPGLINIWAPGRIFINAYGPTETTVAVTQAIYDGKTTDYRGVITKPTIGKPIGNIRAYLLDRHLEPVPHGVHAELLIGGVGVTRGYYGQPRMTAAKFIPDPYSTQPGARVYCTGDKARYQRDGNIDFLGRIDLQVQLRGYRIEPSEIETVICEQPEIRDAWVMVREDRPGDRQLVAYVSSEAEEQVKSEELSTYLASRLPEYMVPTAIVQLKTFPLTPTGMVDTEALPEPNASGKHLTLDQTPASTETEKELVKIWATLLGIEQVGIHANFFKLGGHSLLATQALSRMRETFTAEVPLRYMFEYPTVATLANQIDQLPQDGEARQPRIVPVARQEHNEQGRQRELPLSYAQQRLWFLDKLEGPSATYNLPDPFQLEGALEVAALENGLSDLIERHESLRTNFILRGEQPEQIIQPVAPTRLAVIDLGGLSPETARSETKRLTIQDANRPFRLAYEPLYRFSLVRHTSQSHVLLINMHHIISDGWSFGIFMRDLKAAYRHRQQGEPALPALPVQYADYSHWERAWLRGEVIETMLSYWKQKLAGAPDLLQLPLDYPRPAVQTYSGDTYSFTVENATYRAMREQGEQKEVTPFITMLSAFNVLLAVTSSQEDIVVGTPIANRSRRETEQLIGFFVNTLALRNDLSGDPSYEQILERTKTSVLDDFGHQAAPFEQVVEAIQPQRTLSYSPLFQVMFTFVTTPEQEAQLPGVTVKAYEGDEHQTTAKFDLSMGLSQSSDGLEAVIEYSTALFSAATITRMAGHYQNLLQQLGAQPQTPITKLTLLSEAEKHQLLVAFNDTASRQEPQIAYRQIEERAARQPNAEALVYQNVGLVRLDYSNLNRRANRLAHGLRAMGIEAETPVAISLPRSEMMIIALLAVHKAGAAYLPMDPNYPQERLAYMQADSGAQIVITEQQGGEWTPNHVNPQDLIDRTLPEHNPERQDQPEQLSHVIYTSGSTGTPKGVAISQRGVSSLIEWAEAYYEPADWQGVLASTSICFDLSIFEIFGTLSQGGKLVLAENALSLPSMKARNEVVLINTVPTAMAELIEQGIPSTVRVVNLAGEPLTRELVDRIYEHPHVRQVNNLYGPSEATTYATATQVPTESKAIPLIGKPVTNTRAYVLGRTQELVPPSLPGELMLAGQGIARGYLGRPGQTAERFIPDPYSSEPGGRLYRTGDLARNQQDGALVYMGRMDHQVKLRGFRIELGEIESVLQEQEQVAEALAVIREDTPNEQRLVAYVTRAAGETLNEREMLNGLRTKMPHYMVPNALVALEEMPLLPNGKLDRNALPQPDIKSSEPVGAEDQPADRVEEQLSRIWAKILGREQVGIHDNFFDMGGHSTMGIRLLTQVNTQFGMNLPLTALFQGSTVAHFAKILREFEPAWTQKPMVPLHHQTSSGNNLFMVHPVGGNVLCYRELSKTLGKQISLYGIQSPAVYGDMTQTTVEEHASHYLKAIQAEQPKGPYAIGGWSMGGVIAYEMAQQMHASGERNTQLYLIDSYVPEEQTAEQEHKPGHILATFIEYLAATQGKSLGMASRIWRRLNPESDLESLVARAKKMGILEQEVETAEIDRLWKAYEHNYKAGLAYKPKAYPNSLTLYQAEDQKKRALKKQAEAWRQLTAKEITVRSLAGDHYTLMQTPNIQVVAEDIKKTK